MQSDWILDVLADLRSFALSNGLPALAEHLDDTAMVALAEFKAHEEKTAGSACQPTYSAPRQVLGGARASENARGHAGHQ